MKGRTQNIIMEFFDEKKELECLKESILQSINVLVDCIKAGKKILVCGNGGSAADSEHIELIAKDVEGVR